MPWISPRMSFSFSGNFSFRASTVSLPTWWMPSWRLSLSFSAMAVFILERAKALTAADQVLGGLHQGQGALGLAGLLHQLFLQVDDLLAFLVGQLDGLKQDRFGFFLGPALDHDHGLAAGGHNQVQGAFFHLLEGGVDHQIALDPADPHAAEHVGHRDVGNGQGGRGGGDGQNIRVVFLVGGDDRGVHLDFVEETVGKEGADGAVDEAGGEGFLGAGAAFALEPASRDAARGGGLLAVFHRQGEKILARHGLLRPDHGHQHDRLAELGQNGSVGLLGHAARFKG